MTTAKRYEGRKRKGKIFKVNEKPEDVCHFLISVHALAKMS